MKTLIFASAAVLALGAGSAFAAGTAAQTQSPMNDTQIALQAPQQQSHSYALGTDSGDTVVHSGGFNQLFPSFQGGA